MAENNNKRPKLRELAYMLGVYSNKTIPQTYIGEFSNYELLLTLLQKINEIIERCNIYTDALDEIARLIDDLDDEIIAEVDRILQEMYDNGEFADILEDLFRNEFARATAPRNNKIDTRREFRICRESMPYNTTTVDGEWYSYMQGGKMFEREGTMYYVCCLKISNSRNSYYNNNQVDVRLYRKSSLDGTWEFVRHQKYPFGHGNDICYVSKMDKFIITFASEWSSILNRNVMCRTFAIVDWSLPNDSYNILTNTYVFDDDPSEEIGLTAIDYFDGKLWFSKGAGSSSSTIRIDTLDVPDDWENYENWILNPVTKYARFNVLTADTPYVMVDAGFCQNEDYIFLGNTAPAGIYRFNKLTKQIDNFYEIGDYTNAHMYPTGEMENLSCVNDIIYIGASIHGNQDLWYYDYAQVFSFDFINNLNVPSNVITAYGGTYRVINLGSQYYTMDGNSKVWHFDLGTVNSAKKEISNPNGMSGNYGDPFPTWEEAVLFINAQDLWESIHFRQQTKWMVEYVVLNSDKNIFIDGATFWNARKNDAGVTDPDANDPEWYPRVGGLWIDGTNVAIDHMWIQNFTPHELSSYRNQQVWIRNSNATIHSCVFYVTGRSDLAVEYQQRLVTSNRGILNIYANKPITYNSGTGHFELGNNYIYSTVVYNEDKERYYLKYIEPYVSTVNAMSLYTAGEHTGAYDRYFVNS